MSAVPKRADERAGHRTKAELAVDKVVADKPTNWGRVPTHWHALAKGWYRSLQTSPQARFYVDSDVWAARLAAEMMTEMLENVDPSRAAALLKTIHSMMSDLMTTEGSRRRLAIEVATTAAAVESTEDKVHDLMKRIVGGQNG